MPTHVVAAEGVSVKFTRTQPPSAAGDTACAEEASTAPSPT